MAKKIKLKNLFTYGEISPCLEGLLRKVLSRMSGFDPEEVTLGLLEEDRTPLGAIIEVTIDHDVYIDTKRLKELGDEDVHLALLAKAMATLVSDIEEEEKTDEVVPEWGFDSSLVPRRSDAFMVELWPSFKLFSDGTDLPPESEIKHDPTK